MSRRLRSIALPGIYHITHRCHNKEFLFKFSKHRDVYCEMLLEMTKRYPFCKLLACNISMIVFMDTLSTVIEKNGGFYSQKTAKILKLRTNGSEKNGFFWMKQLF